MRTLVVVLAGLLLICETGADVDPGIDALVIPGLAELVQQESSDIRNHVVALGSLKKVNHQLEPEAFVTVSGEKRSRTFYLPDARNTRDIADDMRAQLEKLGTLKFECRGRRCGSSSDWANWQFKRSVLYGPEQYQHYFVARTHLDERYYVVYIGQRATGKIYLHIEFINPRSQN